MSEQSAIVITEFMAEEAVASLRAHYTVRYAPDLVDKPDLLHTSLAGARALIVRNRTQVDAALLAHAPLLEVVGRLGVGLDNIDQPACGARGIAIHAAQGANARAVAEYVLAMTLLGLRGAYGSRAEVGSGAWPRSSLVDGREAAGKTLGLVGFGDIGQLTASLANAIGIQVVAHDPAHANDADVWAKSQVKPLSLDALLAVADVVSLHLPLLPATRGLFGEANISCMKRGAILINTARGGIVDEAALAAALRSGHLVGAAIDVFAQEPLPAGSPLAGLPNVWLTPHIAGLTREANVRVSSMVAEAVHRSLTAAG